MKNFLCAACAAFFAPFVFAEILLLSPGEKILLPLPPDKVAHVSGKKILSLSPQGPWLSVLGKRKGAARLVLGSKSYEAHVLSPEQKRKVQRAAGLLKNFWGLGWSLSPEGKLLVTGTLNRLFDWVKLAEAARAYNISYEFQAQLGEGLRPAVEKFFAGAFKGRPAPEIQWSRLPAALTPKGGDLNFYARQLRPFGLIAGEDEAWFARPPFIEIEIALVESGLSAGFSFGGKPGGKPQEAGLSSFLQEGGSLLGFLDFMKSEGRGKTIHHSSLFAQNGQEAHVQSGGQLPFSQYHAETNVQTVRWKSYGFSLSITPLTDKKGSIQLKISGEMSEPLPLLSPGGPPPLKRQSLKTTVFARDGEIFPLFRQKKKGAGALSHGGLAASLPFLKSLLRKESSYAVSRFILLQPKILKKGGRK